MAAPTRTRSRVALTTSVLGFLLTVCALVIMLTPHGRRHANALLPQRLANSAPFAVIDGLPLTVARCLDTSNRPNMDVHTACVYENLYFHAGKWVAIMQRERYDADVYDVWTSSKHGSRFHPNLVVPSAGVAKEVNAALDARPGLVIFFGQLWTHNIGHALWDGLYAAWVAAVRTGQASVKGKLTLVVDQGDQERDMERSVDFVFKRFGGVDKYIRLRDLVKEKGWIRFERVVMGSGAKGQRWMNKDMRLTGYEDGAVQMFRDRMYAMHDLPPARPWTAGRSRKEINAIIVDNKRYTEKEREVMNQLVELAEKHGYQVKYVDWGKIGEKPDNVGEHLKILRVTDIYISGPGTGMMYASFLPDQAVFIGLGGFVEQDGRKWVSYMEEYVIEGTPYIRGLYYPSRLRAGGIRLQMLAGMLDTAIDFTVDGFEMPPPKGSGLSLEGQIFVRACYRVPDACQVVLDNMNGMLKNSWDCLINGWADYAVYEQGHYSAIKSEKTSKSECMPAEFRTAMREEVRLEREKSHSLARPCKNLESCEPLLQYHVSEVSR